MACGSRGPLDDDPVGTADAGADVATDATTGPATTPADAGGDAGPLACAGCVVGTCGQQIVSCLGSTQCVGILECVTTTCLASGGGGTGGGGAGSSDAGADGGKGTGGRPPTTAGTGGLDAACLLGCLSKNPAGALSVIGIFQCVSGTCGTDCGAVLGGLGSLGGLGGLGGGGGKAPIDQVGPIDASAFREVFTPLVLESRPSR